MRWTGRRRRRERALVEECEAYLTGRSRARFESAGQPVPIWAWVNVLAHGDLPAVEAAAAAGAPPGNPEAVVADMAQRARILVLWGMGSLAALQHDRLIPLEFALAKRYGMKPPGNAEELAEAIRSELSVLEPPGWSLS